MKLAAADLLVIKYKLGWPSIPTAGS